jgi:hypothetical protein
VSSYENFLYDFPLRCEKLLKVLSNDPDAKDYDVTGFISLFGYSALVVHEIIRDNNLMRSEKNNEKLFASSYSLLMQENFISSELCNDHCKADWAIVKQRQVKKNTLGAVVGDNSLEWKSISCDKKVKSVIDTIRNSLAHANTYTHGASSIEYITFASVRSGHEQSKNDNIDFIKVDIIRCSASAFKFLAYGWFRFMRVNAKNLLKNKRG